MAKLQRAIAIGASAGGIEALKEVVSQIPADLPASVFVAVHIPPFVASSLPEIISKVALFLPFTRKMARRLRSAASTLHPRTITY